MNWEVYAIRYGRHERTAQTNFLLPVPDAHEAMPLDYFIWLLRAPDGQEIVVDTGFDEETAGGRGRTIARNVRDSLKAMGTDAAQVSDVIITHLHYDHAGSLGMFPGAKFHLQEREMHFATGRHMCVHAIRLPFEAAHVVAMVKALYADRVVFHDGDGEVAPGVSRAGLWCWPQTPCIFMPMHSAAIPSRSFLISGPWRRAGARRRSWRAVMIAA
jgi:glyoxylase-like metal-dependent hydrolase (beta-lactamase superfamily II)